MKKLCAFFVALTCVFAGASYAADMNQNMAPMQNQPYMNQNDLANQGAPIDPNGMNQGPMDYQGASSDSSCCAPADAPVGDCYCKYVHYKPCYYYTCSCEYCPKYTYQRCCRQVPQPYCVTRCRMVPQYYQEQCCRYVPQYYYTCHCTYCPKYNYQKCCRYVPQYYYKHECKPTCEQPCCPAQGCSQ